MEEKNKQSKRVSVHDKITYTNGVVITVYVESVKTRLEYPIKKTKPRTYFNGSRVSGIQGYDRRAQLLAHSRQLRNQGSENVSLQTKTIKKGPQQVRICSCSPSTNRRRYRRVVSKVSLERNKSQNKKSNGKRSSTILIKVRNMLKEMSCKEI
ncbi:unnamed protein product [Lupinus luteus]|uniref:Uncharacterized protein n=1 Tax=Lupinus luteus TaxID=3873 RepID=A0AAV1XDW8_LUPLU